jgi:small subunit ribosomal protein S13
MRIAGVDIPNDKKIGISLSYIYGVGRNNAKNILEALNINAQKRTKELSEAEVDKIRDYLDKNIKIEGDLRSEIAQNIKRLKEIGTYRGLRHSRNLPVRGQRTKTNARTKRGRRVTVGSGRKAAAEKT